MNNNTLIYVKVISVTAPLAIGEVPTLWTKYSLIDGTTVLSRWC